MIGGVAGDFRRRLRIKSAMRSPSLKFPKGEVKILIPATEPESPLDNGQLLPLITDQVGNEVRKAKTREYHESDSCGSRAGPASRIGRANDTLNY